MSAHEICEFIEACPMYAKFQNKGTLAVWKINYCEADYERCKRYEVRVTGTKPPDTMLPNGELLRHAS